MSDLDQWLADLSSGDDGLAECSVARIVESGHDAVPGLLALRDSEDVDTRWWAYCALGQLTVADAGWLIPGLKDTSPDVRESAALALSHHPDVKAISPLITALDDEDRMVASLAGRALTRIGGEAFPALIEKIENGSSPAKIEAARALSEIRDPRAIPVFMEALENGSELVKFWAEQGLENLDSEVLYFKPN